MRRRKVKEKHGEDPKEFIVGYDALAIFTHKSNPATQISIEQLHEIFTGGSKVKKWEEVGPGGLTGWHCGFRWT